MRGAAERNPDEQPRDGLLPTLPALNAYVMAHSATKNRLKMRKYDS